VAETFRATIRLSGKTATGIPVPPEVVASLGGGKRPPVRATINGYTFRTTVAPMGGEFMLPVSGERREGAGVAAGDEVEVHLELDAAPREVELPADFAQALDSAAGARGFFDGLTHSQQQWHVVTIEGAKSAETRQRRIDKSIHMLAGKRAR